jgi:hypothetical protein
LTSSDASAVRRPPAAPTLLRTDAHTRLSTAPLAEIKYLHALVVVRLRSWQRAGPNRDPASIRQGLQDYCDAVIALVNDAEVIIP